MSEFFTADFFEGNRNRLREKVKPDVPIVITANGRLQRGGDSTFPFHQDANLWYLTGINEPDVLLVVDTDGEYIILPQLSDHQEIFDGDLATTSLQKTSGISTVLDNEEGWKKLKSRLGQTKQIAMAQASKAYIETYGMYTNPARAILEQKMRTINTKLEFVDVRRELAAMRMVKQPAELRAIQAAIEITIKTLEEAELALGRYKYEYELEAAITYGFRRRGAVGHAFTPIVASGDRACTLHNVANNGELAVEDLVVMDVGAEVSHYMADITRTVSIGGKPSNRQQQVYDAVEAVQDFALGLQKPGALIKENEQKIEKFMGQKLKELGLIKNFHPKDVRNYYPHSTSHFLGLDVHDAGDYTKSLEPGVVLTVEPGIYIPEEKIGVRIEDDVLITENGYKVLSHKLKREL